MSVIHMASLAGVDADVTCLRRATRGFRVDLTSVGTTDSPQQPPTATVCSVETSAWRDVPSAPLWTGTEPMEENGRLSNERICRFKQGSVCLKKKKNLNIHFF